MPRTSGVILIIEDSSHDAVLFSVALEEAGIGNPIIFTSSYEETVDYILGRGKFASRAEFPLPAFIFLDLHLPRVTGFETLAWLRANESTARTNVAMMSNVASEADARHALKMGAVCFLPKPITTDALIESMRELREQWPALSATIPPFSG